MTESPSPHPVKRPAALLSALLFPFAYFFMTRVQTVRLKIGWASSYLVPVLALSIAGNAEWMALARCLLVLVAVYSAYEFGYIVNDVLTAEREAAPTHRIDAKTRPWFRKRLLLAFCVRFALASACMAAVAFLQAPAWPALVAGWLAIWPLFAVYNRWRGRVTIALYLLLVGLRYLLPIWAAAGTGYSWPHWLLMLLLYPLPTTIVAAWKPRYGLEFLKRPFGGEKKFRVLWHAALLGASASAAWLTPQWMTWPLVAVCAYYFGIRLLSAYALGAEQTKPALDGTARSFATMRVTLANLFWILGDKGMAMALGLLIFGMIGRALGPAGAGHFAFAAALLQVALGLSLVCSASALLPRFCRMHAALPGAIANVFAVRMAASLMSLAAVSLYCVLVIEDPERRSISLVMLLAVPLIEPFAVIAMYWNSRNHNRPNVVARLGGLLARTAVVAIGIAVGAAWWVLAMAWVIEAAIGAFVQTRQLKAALPGRRLHRFVRRRRAAMYLRFGARFVVGSWLHVAYTRLDRLLLGERMPTEAFGLYATAMQLTDVWVQVAQLIGLSLATAHLYHRIRSGRFMTALFGAAGLMAAVGLTGLAGAWLFGSPLLRIVFGEPFAGSQPYLMSGAALAVLLFANQIVQLTMATLNRPAALVVMWTVAVVVAVPAISLGYGVIGAHAGPAGLATGLIAGWLSLTIWRRRSV